MTFEVIVQCNWKTQSDFYFLITQLQAAVGLIEVKLQITRNEESNSITNYKLHM